MNLHPYQRRVFALFCALTLCLMCSVTALATDDPLTVVNNLSSFIFSLIKAIGMIILAFGIVQVGLSLKSHDASQRATGFLTVAGGIIICRLAKEILDLITAKSYGVLRESDTPQFSSQEVTLCTL